MRAASPRPSCTARTGGGDGGRPSAAGQPSSAGLHTRHAGGACSRAPPTPWLVTGAASAAGAHVGSQRILQRGRPLAACVATLAPVHVELVAAPLPTQHCRCTCGVGGSRGSGPRAGGRARRTGDAAHTHARGQRQRVRAPAWPRLQGAAQHGRLNTARHHSAPDPPGRGEAMMDCFLAARASWCACSRRCRTCWRLISRCFCRARVQGAGEPAQRRGRPGNRVQR